MNKPIVFIADASAKSGKVYAVCQECRATLTGVQGTVEELTTVTRNHVTSQHIDKTETIAEEATRIVYGDREQAYDDPNRNFKKLAHMWTGTLMELLKPGAIITPQLVALCLIQLKISRESFKPSRENRVDGIGYWLCADRVAAEEGKNDAI